MTIPPAADGTVPAQHTTSVAHIVNCLRRYWEHRASLPHGGLRAVSVAELADLDTSPTGEVAELLQDPVRSALRGKVRDVGWRLFVAGGLDAMHRVAEAVENAMPDCPSFAGSTLDKWWDGIGGGKGNPGWMA